MQSTQTSSVLEAMRFAPEVVSMQSLRDDPDLREPLSDPSRIAAAAHARQQLLTTAVRIEADILPALTTTVEDIARRTRFDRPLEFYIYSNPEINGAVTQGRDHVLVMLSSGAVERLTTPELEFVIGHELGHAMYGHLDLPVGLALRNGRSLSPQSAMRMLAWQRMAEISADRAGLLCCGSLDVAANAMFKTVSGLSMDGLMIRPHEFADQWDDLAAEVAGSDVDAQHWRSTHPFPILRMKALISYWGADDAGRMIESCTGSRPVAEVDREVEGLLAMMDPLSRPPAGAEDASLAPFLLWGGLYVALSDGEIDPRELDNIRSAVGASVLDAALRPGELTAEACREKFKEAKASRRKPLSALDLHRIFEGVAAIAHADGRVAPEEAHALTTLGAICGVSVGYLQTVIKKAA